MQFTLWFTFSLLIVMALFQVFLALGAPFGKVAWGGKFYVLPNTLRIASLFSAGLFVLAAVTLLEKSNIVILFNSEVIVNVLSWFFVGLFGLSILANIFSESKLEKIIMTPVAFLLTLFSLLAALD